jgi:hypothetical protein
MFPSFKRLESSIELRIRGLRGAAIEECLGYPYNRTRDQILQPAKNLKIIR